MAHLLRRFCSSRWSAAVDLALQRSSFSGTLLPGPTVPWASRLHVISSSSSCLREAVKVECLPPLWLKLPAQHKRAYTSNNAEILDKVNEEISSQLPASKIFAVVHISGRQFKVTSNDLIVVNKIPADIGSQIYLEKVLLAGSENFTLIGRPILSSEVVRVKATVTEHTRTAKVIVFKKKRRTTYKKKKGHRQDVTILRINDIHLTPTLT